MFKAKLVSLAMKAKKRRNDRKAFKSMMLDSGATSHYNKPSDGLHKSNDKTKFVSTASGQIHTTTGQAELPFPQLDKAARITNILPSLANHSLMSVKQLADNGYTTIFHPYDGGATVHDSDSVDFIFKDQALLQAWRDINGMWQIPLQQQTNSVLDALAKSKEEMINNVYELPSTEKAILFLHAALGFPVKSTLIKAINNGNLATSPGLTISNVNKFFPESDETQKGHMKQQRQGVRSTKPQNEMEQQDHLPSPE